MTPLACPSSARMRRRVSSGHRCVAVLMAWLMAACAVPAPFVAPGVVGKPPGDVARLLAASDAGLFPCSFVHVVGDSDLPLGTRRTELSLAPGRYVISLECASAYHVFKPRAELVARPGKTYRVTGYLVDNAVTIFTMRMRVKVEELAP